MYVPQRPLMPDYKSENLIRNYKIFKILFKKFNIYRILKSRFFRIRFLRAATTTTRIYQAEMKKRSRLKRLGERHIRIYRPFRFTKAQGKSKCVTPI